MKDLNKMTEKEFRALPHREWNEDIGEFDSLIILPARRERWAEIKYKVRCWASKVFRLEKPECWELPHLHDSGYRCMAFVACIGADPICQLSGCSDVVHIEGIGGYGRNWYERLGTIPRTGPVRDWSIDCLDESGLLHLFAHVSTLVVGPSLSSFEVFSTGKRPVTEETIDDRQGNN